MSLHIISAPSFLRTLHRCPGWVFATFFPLFPLSHLTWIKDLKFKKQTLACNEKVFILPRRSTWNLKMMVGKMIFPYQGCLVRFHVHLPGGNPHPFDKMVDSLSFGSVRFSKALYFQARTGAAIFLPRSPLFGRCFLSEVKNPRKIRQNGEQRSWTLDDP